MSAANRVLVVSALVVGLCPALASACEEEASAKALAKAEAKAEACVKASRCVVKVKMAHKEMSITVAADESKCSNKAINTQGAHRSGWEPGHLIEPDSMKLGPGDDLQAPDAEQWVIISSRSGVIRFHRYPWSGKKTEGRTLQQYGPYRS